MTPAQSTQLRRALLRWYRNHARELPWRASADPYRVWVSEIMLQQTRVDTVVPYYERWLRRFPTLADLADAEPDDVLKAWEGLGYYSRARNLHGAARLVRERHGGSIPADYATLRSLPGVGDYTAGALSSIAFQAREPAVDGNVRRVLARLFDLADPTSSELRRLAASLLPRRRPGDFNQALMELGATICVPRNPLCAACPVARHCLARTNRSQHERPVRKKRKPIPELDVATAVFVSPDRRLFLVRRSESGLLADLWEFPGTGIEPGESPGDAAARAARAGLAPPLPQPPALPLGTVTHTFSHQRVHYHVFLLDCTSSPQAHAGEDAHAGEVAARWVTEEELQELALPVAQRRIAELARISSPDRVSRHHGR